MPQPIIYAVGDIHGELDLLLDVLDQTKTFHRRHQNHRPAWLITLGDYVDRGPNSAEVVELLMSDTEPLAWFERRVHLLGNHDQMMTHALEGGTGDALDQWLYLGGEETLVSYGAHPHDFSAIPARHVEWLKQRPIGLDIGGFLFAHAGIHPGRPIAEQKTTDMLWIRDAFLDDQRTHERRVIHGHSFEDDQPVIRPNRIGIDTGSGYPGGRLTCLVLDFGDPWGEPIECFSAML